MAKFEKTGTIFDGCYEIREEISDGRRVAFSAEIFNGLGLDSDFKESLCTTSTKNVLRGMHFQTPPADHVKLVYCIDGEVMDVVVDLRKNSLTFGRHQKFLLSSENGRILYIPRGLAHGFLTLSDTATMIYNLTSVYSPENDKGILWSSCGIDWGITAPILSERDKKNPALAEFDSPF